MTSQKISSQDDDDLLRHLHEAEMIGEDELADASINAGGQKKKRKIGGKLKSLVGLKSKKGGKDAMGRSGTMIPG